MWALYGIGWKFFFFLCFLPGISWTTDTKEGSGEKGGKLNHEGKNGKGEINRIMKERKRDMKKKWKTSFSSPSVKQQGELIKFWQCHILRTCLRIHRFKESCRSFDGRKSKYCCCFFCVSRLMPLHLSPWAQGLLGWHWVQFLGRAVYYTFSCSSSFAVTALSYYIGEQKAGSDGKTRIQPDCQSRRLEKKVIRLSDFTPVNFLYLISFHLPDVVDPKEPFTGQEMPAETLLYYKTNII